MKKVIVTGNAGFVGSHLTDKLLSLGYQVVGIDDLSSGFLEYLPQNNPNFTFIQCDISDWNSLSKYFHYFKDVDTIFHVAAKARIQPSISNPEFTHRCNVQGTFNILEMMRMMGIKNIVYSASSSSYGLKSVLPQSETQEADCLNPYALTKWVGEQYCKTWGKLYGINNVCLKYFNVWGPRSALNLSAYSPVVGLFFKQIINDKQALSIVGDGEQRRDMTFIDDVVAANILAMENCKKASGETINIGTGKNYSVNELADMILESCKSKNIVVYGKVNVPPRPAEARVTLADISKAKELLKWEPFDSIESKMDFLTSYYNDYFSKN